MRIEDLLGQREGPVQASFDHVQVLDQLLVGKSGVGVELGHGHGGHMLRGVEAGGPKPQRSLKRRSTSRVIIIHEWLSRPIKQ